MIMRNYSIRYVKMLCSRLMIANKCQASQNLANQVRNRRPFVVDEDWFFNNFGLLQYLAVGMIIAGNTETGNKGKPEIKR